MEEILVGPGDSTGGEEWGGERSGGKSKGPQWGPRWLVAPSGRQQA